MATLATLLLIESLSLSLLVVGLHESGVGSKSLILIEDWQLDSQSLWHVLQEGGRGEHGSTQGNASGELDGLIDWSNLEDDSDPQEAEHILEDGKSESNHGNEPVLEQQVGEWVQLLLVDLLSVQEVEDLEEHEGREDQSQMHFLGSSSSAFVNGGVRVIAALSESGEVVLLNVPEAGAAEDGEHHDEDHPGGISIDGSVVVGVEDSVSDDWLGAVLGVWNHRGEGDGTDDVHDEVDPDELNGAEWGLSEEAVADHDGDEAGKVASHLEGEESLDVEPDVAAPHEASHHRLNIVISDNNRGGVTVQGRSAAHGKRDISLGEGLDLSNSISNDGNLLVIEGLES